VDVTVLTVFPSDGPFTPQGVWAGLDHEERRRKIYRLAYETYIAPVQRIGSQVRKCGKVCKPGAAGLLRDYLNRLQSAGIKAYRQWVEPEQNNVGDDIFDMTD